MKTKLIPDILRIITAIVHPMRYVVYVSIRPIELAQGVFHKTTKGEGDSQRRQREQTNEMKVVRVS